MLKEGWSVNNLYTIIRPHSGHSRILVEQTIGRGTRLPFGRIALRGTIDAVKVMAHDRFDGIIEAANDIQLTLDVEEVKEINTIKENNINKINVVDEHQEKKSGKEFQEGSQGGREFQQGMMTLSKLVLLKQKRKMMSWTTIFKLQSTTSGET